VKLASCTIRRAQCLVSVWHRHLKRIQGGLFAVQVIDSNGDPVGVGIAGNPCQEWQGSGRFVITRVATSGADNACSMIYGALCRAGKALGYHEAWTYTLPEEPGTSLRAAGFIDMGLTDGGEYDRPSRARKPAVRPEPKRRWLRPLSDTNLTTSAGKAGKRRAGRAPTTNNRTPPPAGKGHTD
jgi:hypothetical protein